ncbi:MAG: CRISPR-associated endonuclease Cas1 [Caldiserica bacterium]|nr:CRISPR-associated endonuclease Cas1 [Caldisericota bacterium]
MILIADRFGQFIGRTSERVVIREKGKTVQEIPFFQVEQILVVGAGISLSSDLVRDCAERGITITFLSSSGTPLARLSSPQMVGTVQTRREQLLAIYDQRGLDLAKYLIEGKIKNQISTLKYFARHRKEANREMFELMMQGTEEMGKLLAELDSIIDGTVETNRELLLSIEGRVASCYWDLVARILPAELNFSGRERRGASDPVNSSLNYCYGILYSQIWNALILAGLDPFAGFLHTDRPGKPSLVLDFIEEFRSFVVDRPLIAFFGKGSKVKMEEDKIAEASRRELAQRIFERLEESHTYEGKKHKLRVIIQLQARKLAVFLRKEGPYRPFVGTW